MNHMATKQQQPDPTSLWANAIVTETWHSVVLRALEALGGTASLAAMYAVVEGHPKSKGRKHARDKVRQVLERSNEFVRVRKGIWSLARKHSPEEIERFNLVRRKLYPRRPKAVAN